MMNLPRSPWPPGCLLLFTLLLAPSLASAQDPALQGVWRPVSYVLADGTQHDVDGSIFFVGREWTVLFFVTEDGQARRGSAEGGTFETDGDQLIFHHQYHLSAGEEMAGLAPSPLRMSLVAAADAAREPARYAVAHGRLTVFFPSGNRMEFDGASGS